jgi:signal transduction histidine kinase
MTPFAVDLVRPLARRTSVAATVAAAVLTLGTPITLYLMTHRARADQAASYASRMSELVRDVVVRQPDLWPYDTPKLAGHLGMLVADPAIRHVVVIDQAGRRVDVPAPELERESLQWWATAPVYRGGIVVAHVWVAVDATGGLVRVLLVTLLAWALAALLSTVLYVLPVRVVSLAEHRISSLLEKLELARSELATLNEELEQRVDERSRQLAETAEALRASERKLREVAGRAVEATEQERQRVARELHDGTGQMLTAIRLSLQVLGTPGAGQAPTTDALAELEHLVDETIDEIRRIAVDLHPAALDRLGLVPGLTELCSSVASRSGLEVEFQAHGVPPTLPAAVESSCYRMVQEGLTNAVRHARAHSVRVALMFEHDELKIVISDDGQGFDLDAERSGFGLRGMHDRAALLGGTLSVESREGAGTRLAATFPAVGTVGVTPQEGST